MGTSTSIWINDKVHDLLTSIADAKHEGKPNHIDTIHGDGKSTIRVTDGYGNEVWFYCDAPVEGRE